MSECGILHAPRERAGVCVPAWESVPVIFTAAQECESLSNSSCTDAGYSLRVKGIQVHMHPSSLISSFFFLP